MTDICTVQKLKERLDRGEAPALLDVREADEVAHCALPGHVHIPMGEVPGRVDELAAWKERELVVYCHHGVRSGQVCGWLRQQGFTAVRNLHGGVHAWSMEIDPEFPVY